MTCGECELLLAAGEPDGLVEEHLEQCDECGALAGVLGANALALEDMRREELPKFAIRVPRRASAVYACAAAAAAAVLAVGMLLPRSPQAPSSGIVPSTRPAADAAIDAAADAVPSPASRPAGREKLPPLKIKMLTSDPDVVIYWLIDN